MFSTNPIRIAVRRALVLSAVAATASVPALAQVAPASEQATEEITTVTVTGSRIPQPRLEAASPVSTVSDETIAQTGATRIEDVLNSMPQVAGQFGSGVSNGATGEATVSLRNLGAQRTLVLVNGRRLMPGDPQQNAAEAPDLNQIPASLVERVDILTGGASAVYGADAVAGVVNFVMNDHFQGVRLDGQYSFYNHDNRNSDIQAIVQSFGDTAPSGTVNDGYQRDFDLIAGSNFADGRGNATTYLTYRRTDAVLEGTRDYASCSLTSTFRPSTGALVLGCGGSPTTFPAHFNFNGKDTQLNPTTGQLYSPGVLGYAPYNFAPINYYQVPDERYTAGSFLHYDLNDHARVYTEFMFMDDREKAQIAYSGAFFGQGTAATAGVPDGSFAINCNNPYLSTSELTAWCGGSTTAAPAHVLIGWRNVEGGPRYDDQEHTSYRAVAGIKGDITDIWTYDTYALWGTTRYAEEYFNDVSRTNLTYALDAVKLPNGQIVCQANSTGAIGAPGCVPLNIFSLVNGGDGVTQAADQYISIPGLKKGDTIEEVADASVTGDLGKQGIKLPTAHDGLGVSFGTEYRQERTELDPDEAFISRELAGQGAPTLPTEGAYHVAEIFAEARLPILEDLPLAKSLTAEAGYRWSDYNLAFGSTNTYKLGLEWAPVSDVHLRAMYQRAVRAPNIQELYLEPRVQLDSTFTSDPCVGTTPSATLAQCELTGVTPAEYGHLPRNPANQYNGLVGGNSSLSPEKADTYTAGLVFTPTFLPEFNFTMDYYNISIKDFITQYGGNLIINTCIQTGNPLFCDLIHRTQGTGTAADGSLWISPTGYIQDSTLNLGAQWADGVDASAAYRVNMGPAGSVAFNLVGTYVMKYATAPLPGGPSYNCAGYYGPTCGVPEMRWRHTLRATWTTPVKGLDFYGAWRRFNGTDVQFLNVSPLLTAPVSPPGITVGQHLPGIDYIDLGANYSFLEHLTLRVGANNLFDKEPPLAQASYSPGVYQNGNTFPTVYDALGRYIYMNLTAQF